jgi:glutamine amidotransferase
MTRAVVVVDYGIGNVFSVCNALVRVGASPILTEDPVKIAKADTVILPGVGAFSRAMRNLKTRGLDDAISTFIRTGNPFLGICLGMQVLMQCSTEFGEHIGLGLIDGTVEQIRPVAQNKERRKLPCIGWARIDESKKMSEKINRTLYSSYSDKYFYFVHSYSCRPIRQENLIATVSYDGEKNTAIVGRDNILGVQFHPERSGDAGLAFLKSFIDADTIFV